jgi:hypothetical protein
MRGDITLYLGLVAVVVVGVVVVVVFLVGKGGGGSVCDRPLAPLGDREVSQLAFQDEELGLTRVIQAASVGNVDAAEQAFSYDDKGAVHNFTHNIDAPLREVDEALAKELCEAVRGMEDEFENGRADRVATEATHIRELVRDAAEALGYARPGG